MNSLFKFLAFSFFSVFLQIPSPANAHWYQSNEEQIRLAKHLRSNDAVLYGRDSCIWSKRQKELFGIQASHLLIYEDCEKNKTKNCIKNKEIIDASPMWIINEDKILRGLTSLEELKYWSRYID